MYMTELGALKRLKKGQLETSGSEVVQFDLVPPAEVCQCLQDRLVQGCAYRPMDLRAAPGAVPCSNEASRAADDATAPWNLRLGIGSAIAAEARTAIKVALSSNCESYLNSIAFRDQLLPPHLSN